MTKPEDPFRLEWLGLAILVTTTVWMYEQYARRGDKIGADLASHTAALFR